MTIQELSVTEVKEKLDRGEEFLLLDVREPWEVNIAKIEGSLNIPMDEIPGRLEELKDRINNDSASEIVVYCHLGGRSASVSAYLMENGFKNVLNMIGGIKKWGETVEPALPQY